LEGRKVEQISFFLFFCLKHIHYFHFPRDKSAVITLAFSSFAQIPSFKHLSSNISALHSNPSPATSPDETRTEEGTMGPPAARTISQEAFDELVNENIDDLGMDPDEALEDAIQTLTLQGADLSGENANCLYSRFRSIFLRSDLCFF
jgi:hypothetical protein